MCLRFCEGTVCQIVQSFSRRLVALTSLYSSDSHRLSANYTLQLTKPRISRDAKWLPCWVAWPPPIDLVATVTLLCGSRKHIFRPPPHHPMAAKAATKHMGDICERSGTPTTGLGYIQACYHHGTKCSPAPTEGVHTPLATSRAHLDERGADNVKKCTKGAKLVWLLPN